MLAQVILRLKSSQYFPYGSLACWSSCYAVITAASTSVAEAHFMIIVHIRLRAAFARSNRSFIPSFAALPFAAATI